MMVRRYRHTTRMQVSGCGDRPDISIPHPNEFRGCLASPGFFARRFLSRRPFRCDRRIAVFIKACYESSKNEYCALVKTGPKIFVYLKRGPSIVFFISYDILLYEFDIFGQRVHGSSSICSDFCSKFSVIRSDT